MSDEENKSDANAAGGEPSNTAEAEGADPSSAAEDPPKERVDADGLPLDREPTIDDVRSQEGKHGRIAAGCALSIILVIALFWLIRAGFIG
ncbi:MAG: hypothetical protein IPK82_12650 [Polyangiaceae bacterium]|nr:hypothetical protein [Polyangiaceae bacterium]